MHYIIHICRPNDIQNISDLEHYTPPSLAEVGYIHCSTPQQLSRVAKQYFAESPRLILLWINPTKLNSEIRWDMVGDELFPHIYGTFNNAAIVKVSNIMRGEDGEFHFQF